MASNIEIVGLITLILGLVPLPHAVALYWRGHKQLKRRYPARPGRTSRRNTFQVARGIMIIATGLQVVMGAASVIEQNNLSWAVRAFAGDYSTSLIVCFLGYFVFQYVRIGYQVMRKELTIHWKYTLYLPALSILLVPFVVNVFSITNNRAWYEMFTWTAQLVTLWIWAFFGVRSVRRLYATMKKNYKSFGGGDKKSDSTLVTLRRTRNATRFLVVFVAVLSPISMFTIISFASDTEARFYRSGDDDVSIAAGLVGPVARFIGICIILFVAYTPLCGDDGDQFGDSQRSLSTRSLKKLGSSTRSVTGSQTDLTSEVGVQLSPK